MPSAHKKFVPDLVAAKMLNRAAHEVRARGWAREELITLDGCVCVRGAIWLGSEFGHAVLTSEGWSMAVSWDTEHRDITDYLSRLVMRTVRSNGGGGPDGIIYWNDVVAKSGKQVVAVIDQTVERLSSA
jgi:hypothetical protein